MSTAATSGTRFTPGPWTVGPVEDEESPHALWINAVNGDPALKYSSWRGLAEVYGCDEPGDDGEGDKQMEANASLIAAAPDLYAALKANEYRGEAGSCPECGGHPHMEGCVIQVALAKAEGR